MIHSCKPADRIYGAATRTRLQWKTFPPPNRSSPLVKPTFHSTTFKIRNLPTISKEISLTTLSTSHFSQCEKFVLVVLPFKEPQARF